MTKSIVVLLLLLSLLLATPAYALDEDSPLDYCKDLSIIAKKIMTARQMDKPMSETLPIAIERFNDFGDKYEIDIDHEEVAASLVMAAYETPSYSIEGNQQDAISRFENNIFQDCYTGLTSDNVPPEWPVSSPSGMWAVQLGTFSNKENAEKLASDLRKMGYAVFLSQSQTSAGQWYRVRIGPQKDRESAEAMATRLLKAGHKGEVVPHP